MTPTEQDKKFFAEHHEFFEKLWKPAFGDLVLFWDGDKAEWGKDLWCVIGRYSEDAVDVIRESDGAIGAALIVDCALLARQGQLRAMLEERGYVESKIAKSGGEDYIAIIHDNSGDSGLAKGPTASIALGKCLLEVLKEE